MHRWADDAIATPLLPAWVMATDTHASPSMPIPLPLLLTRRRRLGAVQRGVRPAAPGSRLRLAHACGTLRQPGAHAAGGWVGWQSFVCMLCVHAYCVLSRGRGPSTSAPCIPLCTARAPHTNTPTTQLIRASHNQLAGASGGAAPRHDTQAGALRHAAGPAPTGGAGRHGGEQLRAGCMSRAGCVSSCVRTGCLGREGQEELRWRYAVCLNLWSPAAHLPRRAASAPPSTPPAWRCLGSTPRSATGATPWSCCATTCCSAGGQAGQGREAARQLPSTAF